MERKVLMAFMQRILEKGSNVRSDVQLRQLAELLHTQGDTTSAELVETVISCVREAKEVAEVSKISEADIAIAKRRANERRRREMEAANHGRC